MNDRLAEIAGIDPSWTLEECVAARMIVLERMAEIDAITDGIKGQIETAKAELASTGNYAEQDWWRRVNVARRGHARQRQAYQLSLGNLNRRIKELEHGEINNTRQVSFIRHAKAILPEKTYMEIWSRVDTDFDMPQNMPHGSGLESESA